MNLNEVIKVFAMWKGLDDMGAKEGEANNQRERLLGVEVEEGGDRDLLHHGSDRQTESRLLLGRRIAEERVLVLAMIGRLL